MMKIYFTPRMYLTQLVAQTMKLVFVTVTFVDYLYHMNV